MEEIYNYKSYKKFLNSWLKAQPRGGRGLRAKLAQAVNTQSGYITQVLSSNAHFSMEQGMEVASFIGLDKDETKFLLLLIQYERAGSRDLELHFFEQMESIRHERFELSKRLKLKKISDKVDQATYFSSWAYAAIHVMLLADKWQDKATVASTLGLSIEKVSEILKFLLNSGLVSQTANGGYEAGPVTLHLGKDSPYLLRHHINWNLRALNTIESDHTKGVHYSSVISLSTSDIKAAQAIVTEAIEQLKNLVTESEPEEVYATTINLFSLAND